MVTSSIEYDCRMMSAINEVASYTTEKDATGQGGDIMFWDDLSGKALEPNRVRKARQEDMGELAKHGVYEKVTLEECWANTGSEPIGTRWVGVNEGDDRNPDYRTRLVAQEINNYKREDLFAATPPLQAKKLLFCHSR